MKKNKSCSKKKKKKILIQTQKQCSVPVEPNLDNPCLAERGSKRAA